MTYTQRHYRDLAALLAAEREQNGPSPALNRITAAVTRLFTESNTNFSYQLFSQAARGQVAPTTLLRRRSDRSEAGHDHTSPGNFAKRTGWRDALRSRQAAMTTIQDQEIEHILGVVSGTVFRSSTGEAIILLNEDNYAISVDEDGHTVSSYLVTVPPAEIAVAMDADENEISGWSTGWEC